jgi:2-oxoglutarate dehydrogenase E2 component (dihydrolipoamide succinyltransferase)
MPIELKVPALGESITEVEIGRWLKAKGEPVSKDEPVVALDSEKATVELPSPISGTISDVLKKPGETARVGEVIAYLEENGQATSPAPSPTLRSAADARGTPSEPRVTPAAQRALAETGLRPEDIKPTGPGGRVLKEDVLRHATKPETKPPAAKAPPAAPPPQPAGTRQEEVVPMTRLRRTIAERLVEAHRNAALLTTFNEVDMTAVQALRKEHGEAFQKKHELKLGIMSFFVKSVIEALKDVPQLNAEIRGTDIVFRNYYDIGVAVGTERGLVVPVVRNAERMSFAQVEAAIGDFAKRARENKLKPEELQGGTFTISNGGVYGSLLSTPIVNPPQSGVLGMHAIQERPVAREGAVVIRPMMYIALTYDHRLVDGREAVTFLKRIRDLIENPARMLLEV